MAVLNNWSPPRVSQLLVDADLNLTSSYKLIAKGIQPPPGSVMRFYTGAGVSRGEYGDSTFSFSGSTGIRVKAVNEYVAGDSVSFPNGLKTDSINDNGAGVIDILESVALATGKSASVDSLLTDGISERTESANISLNSRCL